MLCCRIPRSPEARWGLTGRRRHTRLREPFHLELLQLLNMRTLMSAGLPK